MFRVLVLMSAYNGEKYLRQQLDSILRQKGVDVGIIVRDDGSCDSTREILEWYEQKGDIILWKGENIGYIKSFLLLLGNAPEADFYAFSDQDDIWESDKLLTAIDKLTMQEPSLPLLYTSALRCVDGDLKELRIQNFEHLRLDFYSEFVRHRFAGCTFVLNKRLQELCGKACRIPELRCAHDSFVTLLCWAAGGIVLYDPESHILFRRHGSNASVDGMGRLRRLKHEFSFLTEKKNYKLNTAQVLLQYYEDSLGAEQSDFLKQVCEYQNSLWNTLRLTFDKRLNCGIRPANFLFRVSVLIRCL